MPAGGLLGGRSFTCAWCHDEVVVCCGCDHGQRYCSRECREQGRRTSLRRCGQRYQSKAQGRCRHALRQRRYRARQRQRQRQQEIVTHQGSQQPCSGDVLAAQVSAEPNVSAVAPGHCHWCAKALTGVLRRSFLRRDSFEDPLAQWMKGIARGQSP